MTTSSPSRARWHTLIIFAATAGLLWLFFRNVDFKEAWTAIKHAHPGLIAAAIGVTFITYSLRAIRWRLLLLPLGPVRWTTAFRTTVIGFAMIFLLPGRVGEILRPYLLARHEGLKAPSTFATVIVERLLDVVTVLLLFAVSLFLAGVDVSSQIRLVAGMTAGGSVVALVMLGIFAGHPERLGRWAGALSRWLPAKIGSAVGGLVQTFVEGLAVMRSPGHLAAAAVWSVAVWASIAFGIWLTSLAFDLTLSPVGSFIVVGYLAVGVSLPTPGGAGGFHYFYKEALTTFFGADPDVAAAAAIVLHAVSFVPVTIVGLYFMWRDGLTLSGLKGMRAEAQAAEKL
jgi:glycosyltransferase 2 family protein